MDALDRRTWIKLAVGGAAGLLAGCGRAVPAPAGEVVLSLDDCPPGGRKVVFVGTVPVEVRREGDEVFARSLQCPHQGCLVVWGEAEGRYTCTCHQSRFDASGRPISGPAVRPLAEVAVSVRDGRIALELP